jgi:methionyl-tRNA formyltransferase
VTAGRARTVFVGSGGFGRPSLERLRDHPDIDLVGVVTAPPRPAGRRQALTPTPIGSAATEWELGPILTPTRLRALESIDAVLDLRPDLLVLADYGQIVPTDLLGLPHGALNLHPSLLPRHRGATPVPAAILTGDRETGVTLMHMDEGLDTGPIVAQERVALAGTETAPELEARLAVVARELLGQTVGRWLQGEIEPRPQPDEGATMTRPLLREDGRLDVHEPADVLERQVRAYQPWPGSFVDSPEGRLIVWAAGIDSAADGPRAGVFDRYGIGTGAGGRLRLVEVQPAGGKRMTWSEFIRGHPAIVGASIVG